MTTADYGEWGEPAIGSLTRHPNRMGGVSGRRKVRRDGSVLFLGRVYCVSGETQTKPEPGEWLEFYDYGPIAHADAEAVGRPCFISESTAPADPDGYIRRMFWHEPTP